MSDVCERRAEDRVLFFDVVEGARAGGLDGCRQTRTGSQNKGHKSNRTQSQEAVLNITALRMPGLFYHVPFECPSRGHRTFGIEREAASASSGPNVKWCSASIGGFGARITLSKKTKKKRRNGSVGPL